MLSRGFTLLFGTSITTQVPKEGVGLVLIFFEIWICGGGKERWHFFWDQRNEVESQKKWSPIQLPKEARKGLLLRSRFVANQRLTLLCFGITPQIKIPKEVRTNPSPKSSNEGTSIETCICGGRREGPYA
jgi:hypothetical protein